MSSMTVLLLLVISKILTATAKEGHGKEEVDAAGAIIKLLSQAVPSMDTFFERQAKDGPLKHTTEAIVESFIAALKKHSVQPVDGKIKSAINTFIEKTAPNFADKMTGGAERIIKEQLEKAIDLPGITDENALEILDQWTGSPLNNPIYKTLWLAFSQSTWSGEDIQDALQLYEAETSTALAPYFIMDHADWMIGKGRRSFEATFWIEYASRMGSVSVQTEQSKLNHAKALTYQEAMLRDMASWGANHVFGNETYSQYVRNNPPTIDEQAIRVPFLPLDEMYVAPKYTEEYGSIDNIDILNKLMKPSPNDRLQIILANFGMGKSLTSRMYAAKLAQAHLKDSRKPIPIYIVCRECLKGKEPLVAWEELFEKAFIRFFSQQNMGLSKKNKAFPQFDEQQNYIFILDGFDEIYTTPDHRQQWFNDFDGTLGANRCVIFSRPGLMGDIDYPNYTKIRTLRPFDEAQTKKWVERWNNILHHQASPLDPQVFLDQIDTLEGLAILMFMYALIYQQHNVPPTNKSDIYNRFVLAVAAGKYQYATSQQNAAKHKQIQTTNRLLRAKLEATNEVVPPNQAKGPDAQPMIWLLAQLAWKERCLYTDNERLQLNEGEPVPMKLTDAHLVDILNHQIGIPSNEVEQYIPGAILAVQTNENFQNGILFTHKSFKEFLCAKRWMFALQKWMNGHFDKYADNDLYDAPLAHPSEQTTNFLYDLIQLHKKTDSFSKKNAIGHLEKILNTLEMCAEKPEQTQKTILLTNPKDDISWRIRRVIFQVLCWLHPEDDSIDSYHEPDMDVFWLLEFIDKFQSIQGLSLPQINLNGANLNGANLTNANLTSAKLNNVDLNGAKLTRANLTGANLTTAKCNGADLTNVDLTNAKLTGTKLNNADLTGANLTGAKFIDADLTNAKLTGADLTGAYLTNAKLNYADLNYVDLTGADLTGADLTGAYLNHANLSGANLSGANLESAKLNYARLNKAIFQSTLYYRTDHLCDGPTQWPETFNPKEHEGLLAAEDSQNDRIFF